MTLDGKVVFITGAARGIGAAVAAEAHKRGAKISLSGLEPELLAEVAAKLGPDTPHFECDVTDMDSVQAAVDGTVEALGGIDIVLANAGIGTYGTVEKGSPEAFLRTIDINLNGVYRTVHATLPHILATRGYISVVASIGLLRTDRRDVFLQRVQGRGRDLRPRAAPRGRLPWRRRRHRPPLVDRHRPGPRRRGRHARVPREPVASCRGR